MKSDFASQDSRAEKSGEDMEDMDDVEKSTTDFPVVTLNCNRRRLFILHLLGGRTENKNNKKIILFL